MIRYVAKLTGPEKLQTYVGNLVSQPVFNAKRISKGKEKVYEIHGPVSKDAWRKEDIESDLVRRSEKLEVTVPGLANKVAHDIFCAQEGQRLAIRKPMRLLLSQSENRTVGHATLDLPMSEDHDIDECARQYALLRIVWLADTLGMSLEKSPESFILH